MSTTTPLDDLTEKQRAFVFEFSKLGAERGTRIEACKRAGYEGDNLDVVAWDLMRKPKIVAAVKYMLEVRYAEKAPEMMDIAHSLAQGKLTGNEDLDFKGQPVIAPGVRLQAVERWLDRAGMAPVTKSEQKIEYEDKTQLGVIEYNQRLAIALQSVKTLPPEERKLLENKLKPIDAEFQEVPDLGFLDE